MFNLFILASWKDSYFLFDITTNNKTTTKQMVRDLLLGKYSNGSVICKG